MKNTRKNAPDFFLDLAQVANGAISTLGSLRAEIDVIRAGRSDRHAAVSGSVPREDFDAALSRIDALAARIAILEARLVSPEKSSAKTKTKNVKPAKAKTQKRKRNSDL